MMFNGNSVFERKDSHSDIFLNVSCVMAMSMCVLFVCGNAQEFV